MKGSSKLSDLKEGDWFNFRNNVTAKYIVGSYSLQDLETKEFMRFKVLKVNPTTVKCQFGNIQYTFKFAGQTQPMGKNAKKELYLGVDHFIQILKPL